MTRITCDGNVASNSLPPYPEAFHSVSDIRASPSLARTSSTLNPLSESANRRISEIRGLMLFSVGLLAQEQTSATIAIDNAETMEGFIDAHRYSGRARPRLATWNRGATAPLPEAA